MVCGGLGGGAAKLWWSERVERGLVSVELPLPRSKKLQLGCGRSYRCGYSCECILGVVLSADRPSEEATLRV